MGRKPCRERRFLAVRGLVFPPCVFVAFSLKIVIYSISSTLPFGLFSHILSCRGECVVGRDSDYIVVLRARVSGKLDSQVDGPYEGSMRAHQQGSHRTCVSDYMMGDRGGRYAPAARRSLSPSSPSFKAILLNAKSLAERR